MERVMRSIPPDVCEHGLFYGEILHPVNKILGKSHNLTIKEKPEKLSTYLKRVKVKSPQILLCKRVEIANPDWQDHYIVVDAEENVYDPLENGVISTKDVYTRKQANWLVLGLIY